METCDIFLGEKNIWEKWWWWWSVFVFPVLAVILSEFFLSAKELGKHIDKPVRTIENWAAAGYIAQNEQGKYGLVSALSYQLDKVKVDLARTKLLLEEKNQELDKSDEELEIKAWEASKRKVIAEADKEKAIARIKQLELDKLQGNLIDAEEVEAKWANLITTCVAKFTTLPTKLALQLSAMEIPSEIQKLLMDSVFECLSELGELPEVLEIQGED